MKFEIKKKSIIKTPSSIRVKLFIFEKATTLQASTFPKILPDLVFSTVISRKIHLTFYFKTQEENPCKNQNWVLLNMEFTRMQIATEYSLVSLVLQLTHSLNIQRYSSVFSDTSPRNQNTISNIMSLIQKYETPVPVAYQIRKNFSKNDQ